MPTSSSSSSTAPRAGRRRHPEHNQELRDCSTPARFALAQQSTAGADDEHLSTCQGAQSEARSASTPTPTTRAHQQRTSPTRRPVLRERASDKNFLWLLVEEIGLDALKAKVTRR